MPSATVKMVDLLVVAFCSVSFCNVFPFECACSGLQKARQFNASQLSNAGIAFTEVNSISRGDSINAILNSISIEFQTGIKISPHLETKKSKVLMYLM